MKADDLKKHGPMYCAAPDCVAFRQKDPAFAQRLQDAGIIAHHHGFDAIFGEDIWTLSGITPITRGNLECLIRPPGNQ